MDVLRAWSSCSRFRIFRIYKKKPSQCDMTTISGIKKGLVTNKNWTLHFSRKIDILYNFKKEVGGNLCEKKLTRPARAGIFRSVN